MMRTRGRARNGGRLLVKAGGGAAAPAPWTPASLPSLAAWYTAGPAYCFTDAGGTVAAGDGDMVRVWKDRGGNARDLSQATASFRPILYDLGGGVWVCTFDGVDDVMAMASAVSLGQLTVGAAYTKASAATFMIVLGGAVAQAVESFDDGDYYIVNQSGVSGPAAYPDPTTPQVGLWRLGAATFDTRRNGSAATGSFGGAAATNFDRVGARGAPTFSTGDLGEAVACSAALADADVLLLESYLNAGHPAF